MSGKLIIIGGYCATGKSTFSNKLANFLGIPCFNKDNLKEVMADSFGSDTKEVYKKGSAATFNLMLHIVERFLLTGNVCIIEANFKSFEEIEIKELLKKYDADCLTFVFTGDLDTLYDRYTERDQERHWVHLRAGDSASFKEGQTGLAELSIGQTIQVDATDFKEIKHNDLFESAKAFLQNQV